MRSLRYLSLALAVAAASLVAAPSAKAQVPSVANPPYNQDIGAIITNSLRVAGTVYSDAQSNLNWSGVICRFKETASSGTPSTTFGIQEYDAATTSWSTIVTSGAATTTTADATVLVYPGATLTTTPTRWVLQSVPLPRSWRVFQTIAGTGGPASTSKIGCNLLK